MDNRIFSVNGFMSNPLMLINAIRLAFMQYDEHGRNPAFQAQSFLFDINYGIIVFSGKATPENGRSPFIRPMGSESFTPSHEQLADILLQWLQHNPEQVKSVVHHKHEYTNDCDHDGHNKLGWLVYVNNWSYIQIKDGWLTKSYNDHDIVFAFKPAYIWYGK